MSDKITNLALLSATPAADDRLVIVDRSNTAMATSGTTSQITMTNLLGGMPKVVPSYQGYVVIPGPSSSNRYAVQTGDIIIGKGAFAGGNMIMAVANTNSPSLDSHLDFYVNANVLP